MTFETLALASTFIVFLILISIWSVIWKGLALWKCARYSQKGWFIAIVILNTAGILEIIYLLFFQKKKRIVVKKSKR